MFEEEQEFSYHTEQEDAILPDDYQAEESVEDTQQETADESQEQQEQPEEVDTNETEGMTEQEKQAFLRVKYNKEEIELDEERAKELAQKGLNYDKVQEKLQSLENDPRLGFVEQLAQAQGMDVPQFIEAFNQHQEQQRLNELVQQNTPEELAQEILENRKFREQHESEKKELEQKQKEKQEFGEFLDYFKQANGRDFNPDSDSIPDEVWQAQANGTPLRFAYMQNYVNELQNKLKVLQQNKQNEKKAPVTSVTSHGAQEVAAEDDFLKGFNSI